MLQSLIGRSFGDFLIKEQIGEGGAGEVYRAEQVTLGREAVIKVMRQRDEASGAANDRFLREARLASRLDHPFAAHVYAFGVEADGTMWIAMELVRGTPLNKIISGQGAIPLPRFVPLFERLCEVLNAAHEQGIVHRDIKPANVMVIQRAGRLLPKLLDLGIARGTQKSDEERVDDFQVVDIPDRALSVEQTPTTEQLVGRLTSSESMQLTSVGSIVGTPHYMAPEQWVDASNAGAAADVYSLAILAFECLSGRVPFTGKSFKTLARAHASQGLPPLGNGLPEALDAVLAKGAAKVVEQRYATPLDFAAAVRGASGLGVEPPSLPQFEEGLRDNVLSEAPQPLAEALALLEGARTPRQGVEASAYLIHVMCRLCGVLALAARLRVGAGGPHDATTVQGLLQRLRTTGLDDAGWVALTRALLAPFATRRDAHPVPELVRFFFDSNGEGVGSKAFDGVVAHAPPAREAPDAEQLAFLEERLSRVAHLLESASFLFDYTLVVQKEHAERWAGSRRARRLTQRLVAPAKPGDVLWVDAVGVAVLVLSPLVQCSSPCAGAEDELFFLDGHGRHGARLVAWPSPYERQDEGLWAQLGAQGLSFDDGQAPQHTERAPYKGLSTFSADDADNYFGREHEAESFANRLRSKHFLAVVGPSGTGKSSFILAGVLPLFARGWRHVVLRPGTTPLEVLGAKLSKDRWAVGDQSPDARAEGVANTVLVDEVLVIVVDQFEELVTLCQEQAHRLEFAMTLLALANHRSGRVRVVVTLRDDFLIKVQALAPFRESLASSLVLLSTPAPEDLARVVTEPAKRVGYAFDDHTLPERMVKAVADTPGALALLSFTASQLWELRDRHLQLMRVKSYDALGGVGGALAHHAEATLASFSETDQRLVREAFRNLVTSQGTRAVLSKQEMLDVLGGPSASSVLERLVGARLLVSSETASGDDAIEIIHEALIVSWPRLVGWQREDAEAARLRDALRASARQWVDRGRPGGLLWRKETLAEFRRWKERFPGRLTQAEEAFTRASLRDEARSTAIRRGLAAAAFVALVVGLVLVARAYGEATARLQRLWQEQGRLALVQNKPLEALVYSLAAKDVGAQGPALETVIGGAVGALDGSLGVLTRGDAVVQKLDVSPDGRWLAVVAADEAALVSNADHRVKSRFKGACEAAAFSGDSKTALFACHDTIKVVDTTTLRVVERPAAARFVTLQRDARGHFVGTVVGDTVIELDVGGAPAKLFTVPGAPQLAIETVSTGGLVVYAGPFEAFEKTPRTVRVLRPDGALDWETPVLESIVSWAATDPRGESMALAQGDGTLALFDLTTHALRWSTKVKGGVISGLRFDGAGTLFTIALNGVVSAYNTKTGEVRFAETISRAGLQGLLVASAEHALFVSGADGVVRKVDDTNGTVLWEHHGHRGMVATLALAGEEVVSGGYDGLVWRWSAPHPRSQVLAARPLVAAQASRGQIVAATDTEIVTILPDGGVAHQTLPAIDDTGPLATVDVSTGGVVLLEFMQRAALVKDGAVVWQHPRKTQAASMADDGKHVAIAEVDGAIHWFDTTNDQTWLWESHSKETSALLLFDQVLLGDSDNGDLLLWHLGGGPGPERVTAHKGYFRLLRSSRPDVFLTFGVDRVVLGWSIHDLTKPLFRVSDLPNWALTVNVADDLGTMLTMASTGVVRAYDTAKNKELVNVSYGTLTPAGAVSPSLGLVVRQDSSQRVVASQLKISPPSPHELSAFLPSRVSRRLQNEELQFAAPAAFGAQ